jgi:hypothetical protein
MFTVRLCRAIALAAEDVKLSNTSKRWSVVNAVLKAQKCADSESEVGAESDSELLEGFLALTDGIIYAIKIADPDIPNVKKVRHY